MFSVSEAYKSCPVMITTSTGAKYTNLEKIVLSTFLSLVCIHEKAQWNVNVYIWRTAKQMVCVAWERKTKLNITYSNCFIPSWTVIMVMHISKKVWLNCISSSGKYTILGNEIWIFFLKGSNLYAIKGVYIFSSLMVIEKCVFKRSNIFLTLKF